MGYLFLVIAILAEVFGTAMLKLSEGLSNLFPSLGLAAGFILAFFFLSKALKTLPLSLAYATWAGVGTASTVLVGLFIFGENMNPIQVIGVLISIAGVTLINMSQGGEEEQETSKA